MTYQDVKELSRYKVRNLGVCGAHVKSLGLEKTDHSPALLSNSPPSQGGLLESQEQNEVVNNKDGDRGSPWKPSRSAWVCEGASAQCKHKDILGKWVSVKSGRSFTTKWSVFPRASEEKKVCLGVRDGMRNKEQKERWNQTARLTEALLWSFIFGGHWRMPNKCFAEEIPLSDFLERGPAELRQVWNAWLGLCCRLLGNPRAAPHLFKELKTAATPTATFKMKHEMMRLL